MQTYHYTIDGRRVVGAFYGPVVKSMTEAQAAAANERLAQLKCYGRWIV